MNPISLTRSVKILLVLYGLFFFVAQVGALGAGVSMPGLLGLVPELFVFKGQLWRIFTYSFVHTDVMHLILNALMLAFIGSDIERLWGTRRFLAYYGFCIVFAAFAYLGMQLFFWKQGTLGWPMTGASGGLYGLMIAYGILYGERVMLFMMLFPMKAKHFVWVLAGVTFLTTAFTPGAQLSGVAHLGGMIGGLGMLWAQALLSIRRKRLAAQGPAKKKKKSGKNHLKLVVDNDREPAIDEKDGDDDPKSGPKVWH